MTGNSKDSKEKEDLENSQNEGDEGQIKSEEDMHPQAVEYVRTLMREKVSIDHLKFPYAVKLLEKELEKVQLVGRAPPREPRYINILAEKPIKVMSKVLIPIREFPRFNFVGKLMGPKGSSLKQLQEETMCRISVMGRGSMRDKVKEEELRNSLDPKYSHLSDELNVEISALAIPAEAHARMAYALSEVKKFLTPDKMDDISIRQMDEMAKISGDHMPPPRRQYGQPMQQRSYGSQGGMSMLNKARMSITQAPYQEEAEDYEYMEEGAEEYGGDGYNDDSYDDGYSYNNAGNRGGGYQGARGGGVGVGGGGRGRGGYNAAGGYSRGGSYGGGPSPRSFGNDNVGNVGASRFGGGGGDMGNARPVGRGAGFARRPVAAGTGPVPPQSWKVGGNESAVPRPRSTPYTPYTRRPAN